MSQHHQLLLASACKPRGFSCPQLLSRRLLPPATPLSAAHQGSSRINVAHLHLRQRPFLSRSADSNPLVPLAKPYTHLRMSFSKSSSASAEASAAPDTSSVASETQWPSTLGPLPAFSKKQPPSLPEDTASFLSATPWTLTSSRDGLQRSYVFPSFKNAMSFLSKVAVRCEDENHHPSWSNTYNKVEVLWTTHRPKGLSAKDLRMARYCEEVAQELGEKTIANKST